MGRQCHGEWHVSVAQSISRASTVTRPLEHVPEKLLVSSFPQLSEDALKGTLSQTVGGMEFIRRIISSVVVEMRSIRHGFM